MLKVEPLMDANIETQRLVYALKTHFVSKETDANGLGDVSDARMEKAIKLLADTYKLPNTPAVKDVFDRSFLPPKAERTLKLSF
jgi:NitT/TauT family transport system substrate-binding protein